MQAGLERALPQVLREAGGLEMPQAVLLTRLAQGVLDRDAGTIGDPLSTR